MGWRSVDVFTIPMVEFDCLEGGQTRPVCSVLCSQKLAKKLVVLLRKKSLTASLIFFGQFSTIFYLGPRALIAEEWPNTLMKLDWKFS